MGVLLSGRFAKTTSTYSSCSLWREAFNPRSSKGEGGEGRERSHAIRNSQIDVCCTSSKSNQFQNIIVLYYFTIPTQMDYIVSCLLCTLKKYYLGFHAEFVALHKIIS